MPNFCRPDSSPLSASRAEGDNRVQSLRATPKFALLMVTVLSLKLVNETPPKIKNILKLGCLPTGMIDLRQ